MVLRLRLGVLALSCSLLGFLSLGAGSTQPASVKPSAPLAEGRSGMVVGTTGPAAVQAGLEVLKKGGSAADAAAATALAQIVECGGAYVSFAGIFGMTYYDAASGKLFYLNACYNTPLGETEAQTIPGSGTPSGRSALVPGFMAGVQATHDRFGKLTRQQVFDPAIALAEDGFKIEPMLARFIKARESVLGRLPKTKRVFTKADGSFFVEGDLFRQPELAKTLRQIATHGAAFMYTGEWAKGFVDAVQKEGGKITLQDLQAYQPTWEEPIQTKYREYQICVPGLSSLGGVCMVEALHLLEHADLRRLGHYTKSAECLFWLMQIGHCQVLAFLPSATLKDAHGQDLTPAVRLKKETAAWLWKELQDGKFPFAAKLIKPQDAPPMHSDGIVVVDQWGNVAAVTHSINTSLWGTTGIFVNGVSIPDSAAIQQSAVLRAGPGKRLPDPMCPLLVLKDGKVVLGSSAIGGGLHQKTLQVLTSILDFGMDAQAAVEAPAFMLPEYTSAKPIDRVEQGQFDAKLIDAVKALGQGTKVLTTQEGSSFRGYWVGVQIQPDTRKLIGAGTRFFPSRAEGY